jgi:8-oxo-dGTP diphosphatase
MIVNCGMTPDRASIEKYYASLPRKLMAAGVIFRDERDRVLLVEPNYKTDWEIPGGVVEAGESPFDAARREVTEELGIDVSGLRLWCLDWYPSEPPRSESLMIVFDGGRLTTEDTGRIQTPEGEIRSWSFSTLADASGLLGNRVFTRVELCMRNPDEVLYLEQGIRR